MKYMKKQKTHYDPWNVLSVVKSLFILPSSVFLLPSSSFSLRSSVFKNHIVLGNKFVE